MFIIALLVITLLVVALIKIVSKVNPKGKKALAILAAILVFCLLGLRFAAVRIYIGSGAYRFIGLIAMTLLLTLLVEIVIKVRTIGKKVLAILAIILLSGVCPILSIPLITAVVVVLLATDRKSVV